MKAKRITVNSEESKQKAIGEIHAAWQEEKFFRVSIESNRTLDQNAQSWVWYAQIERELRENTLEGVHHECKLRLGVPILRAEEPLFREFYDRCIKPLPYEKKLEMMRFVPVTSIMTFDQLQKYLKAMQDHWGLRGVRLEFQEKEKKRAAP